MASDTQVSAGSNTNTTTKKTKKNTKPKQPSVPATKPSAPTLAATTAAVYTPYPLANEWGYGSAVSASQPVARGYDVTTAAVRGQRRSAALNASNCILTDGNGAGASQMSVFVTAVSIDTQLAGNTAQAHLTRDFYPHNFVQPSFMIQGISLDQEDYGLLCEFVHSAQHKAVQNGYSNLTQLYVMGRDRHRGIDGNHNSGRLVKLTRPGTLMPKRTSDPSNAPSGEFFNQMVRGSHQPILAKGYVASMPRIHRRFEYAVVWRFPFVVTAMLSGLYSEGVAFVKQEQTWQDILADAKTTGVVDVASLQSLNQQALAYAAQNVTAAFGDPSLPTTPPATAGTGSGSTTGTGATGTGTGGGTTPLGSYNCAALKQLWIANGGSPGAASTAAGVALAESSGNPSALGDVSLGGSHGLWQVFGPAHPQYNVAQLNDPNYNAKAAIAISGNGSNWTPWSTFNSGAAHPC